ncbi:MAG: DUF3794 domain-containing protein [Desulfotomaculaceae bacterium]|nr:DUF3794 domain-containing protein [Desulfotomaculaceae bacterium]MDD4766598.1 DUF3794 domain-containing protein [Desulfotomaculaceae bacterium]
MSIPSQFLFTESATVKCLEIKVPVVIEAVDIEQVVDSTITLPELAVKIDHITASIRDLKGTPVFVDQLSSGDIILVPTVSPEREVWIKKVIVSGTIHKQIFYVNKQNEVRHFAEDVPFSKMQELREMKKVKNRGDVFIQFHNIDVDINWELPRPSRLHQTAVVQLTAKVVEDQQIFVQICPSPKVCPPGNRLRDGGLENWADPYHPVFWGTSNVQQTTVAHSGSYAAELGMLNPLLPGSLFQMVSNGIVGGRQYRLSFWVAECILGTRNSAFALNAEVVFFDENGVQVGIGSQNLSSTGIPDGAYTQVQFTTPVTDGNAASAMVRFSFIPAAGNTNTVRIDDVALECVPLMT